jgi:hypothetical protein
MLHSKQGETIATIMEAATLRGKNAPIIPLTPDTRLRSARAAAA